MSRRPSLIGLDGSFDPRLAEASVPSDPTAVDGLEVIGTTGSRAFIDRLVAIPDTQQVIYGAQMYDCAIVMALAAQAAGSTDPAVYGPMLVTVTSEGRSLFDVRGLSRQSRGRRRHRL